MSVRFNRTGTGVVNDHNDLANKGLHTHAEIDEYLVELDDARGLNPSIDARLDAIEQKNTEQDTKDADQNTTLADHESRLDAVEPKITQLETDMTTAEGDIADQAAEIAAARDTYPTLKDRIDAGSTDPALSGRVDDIEAEVEAARGTYLSLGTRLDALPTSGGGGGGGVSGRITGTPVGTVSFMPANEPPSGWLAADGNEVSRTAYADLFDVIGTLFGEGDGTTTFKLPDLRGEFIRGLDNGRGVDPDRTLGSAQSDEFKAHTHTVTYQESSTSSGDTPWYFESWAGASEGPRTQTSSSTGGTETRPRNVALLACIKYEKDGISSIDGDQIGITVRTILSSEMPTDAPLGEPIYTSDTGQLFFGQGPGKAPKLVSGTGGGGGSGVGGVAFLLESLPNTRAGEQTIFTVPEYLVGSEMLEVMRDGVTLSRQTDYNETDSTTVTFTQPVPVDSHVTFKALAGAPDEVVKLNTEGDLPPTGDTSSLYLVKADSTMGGKPALYSYSGTAYQKVSGEPLEWGTF